VDETYIRSKEKTAICTEPFDGADDRLPIDCHRDVAASKRFFPKALAGLNDPQPRVINVDKNPAYVPAVTELQFRRHTRRRCRLRQCKLLEQHGGARPSNGQKADTVGKRL
jgi:IS6 family transposase